MRISPAVIFASGLGLGFIPFAPGTFGTMLAVAIYWFGLKLLPQSTYAVTAITFVFLAVWISNIASERLKEKDPQKVVIDEIAGFFVTMAFQPTDISYLVGGFILFRLFDIVKPFPAKYLEERLRGGWGIVMDDVVAGLYANIALWCLGFLLPNFV